jgi:hypothetical protein
MADNSRETIGIRLTGWAALNRDPLMDRVEFTCPQCGAKGDKAARRPRAAYHFTDGNDEKRRFQAVFSLDPVATN